MLSLLLFVRGNGARSLDAIRAVRKAVNASVSEASLRMIDVCNNPTMAERYRVVATPTLLTMGGASERRLVGSMSEESVSNQLGGKRDGD